MKIPFILIALLFTVIAEQEEGEFNFNWFQNDYMIIPGHVEVVRYNKNYIRFINARTFKFNRTCVAHNFTVNFKINVGSDLEVVAQSYKFASNEYRLFVIRLGINVCKAMTADIIGIGEAKCGNFTGCPFQKDKTYHMCNFVVNEHKLPPLVPTGSYMLELTFSFNKIELYVLHSFSEIARKDFSK